MVSADPLHKYQRPSNFVPALICTMLWTKYVRNFVLSARDNVYRLLHPREIQENIELSSLAEPPPPSTDTSLSSITVEIVLNKDIVLPNITLRRNGTPINLYHLMSSRDWLHESLMGDLRY